MALKSFTNNVPGREVFAPPPSDNYALVLSANVQKQLAVPTGAKKVLFASTANFFMRMGTVAQTASVPLVDITDGSGPELNPEARAIPDGTTHISCISSETCTVTMAFYA